MQEKRDNQAEKESPREGREGNSLPHPVAQPRSAFLQVQRRGIPPQQSLKPSAFRTRLMDANRDSRFEQSL